ncbi:MAG: PilZ domain-containing protein [Candidatus Omnitrophica bacterium]|nr:PilZ domain-containing protein [Candidatus Omnitrophota bacterium]
MGDFVEVRPLNEVGKIYKGKAKDISLMGICFSSDTEWKKGQVLFIEYFIPEELESIQFKLVVAWSEFVGPEQGYFCGGEMLDVEPSKESLFSAYYFKKLQERFPT